MNIRDNIILFTLEGKTTSLMNNDKLYAITEKYLKDNQISYKVVSTKDMLSYFIVHMSHEQKVKQLLDDYMQFSYLRSWSDRFTEKVTPDGIFETGNLISCDWLDCDFYEGDNYWKFDKKWSKYDIQ